MILSSLGRKSYGERIRDFFSFRRYVEFRLKPEIKRFRKTYGPTIRSMLGDELYTEIETQSIEDMIGCAVRFSCYPPLYDCFVQEAKSRLASAGTKNAQEVSE